MPRFYVRPECVRKNKIYVDGAEAHHILDVMRLKKGKAIIAFDGTGREYLGTIEGISGKGLTIAVEKTKDTASQNKYRITLAQAIPRIDKMDYIIQKATELGVDSIIPMKTKRTIVKIPRDKIDSKKARWNKIAQEAAKQCGRNRIPAIERELDFEIILEKVPSYDLCIIPSPSPIKRYSLKKALSNFRGGSILVLIGPEGGFAPEEIDAASKKNALFVSLGENILRCDTAAISAIAMINYGLGNI